MSAIHLPSISFDDHCVNYFDSPSPYLATEFKEKEKHISGYIPMEDTKVYAVPLIPTKKDGSRLIRTSNPSLDIQVGEWYITSSFQTIPNGRKVCLIRNLVPYGNPGNVKHTWVHVDDLTNYNYLTIVAHLIPDNILMPMGTKCGGFLVSPQIFGYTVLYKSINTPNLFGNITIPFSRISENDIHPYPHSNATRYRYTHDYTSYFYMRDQIHGDIAQDQNGDILNPSDYPMFDLTEGWYIPTFRELIEMSRGISYYRPLGAMEYNDIYKSYSFNSSWEDLE